MAYSFMEISICKPTRKTKAYLYKIVDNKFIGINGFVYMDESDEFLLPVSVFSEESVDLNNIPESFIKKEHVIVSEEAGTRSNCVIWFENRNDDIARNILLDYELSKFVHFRSKADEHFKNIYILAQGLQEEEYNND